MDEFDFGMDVNELASSAITLNFGAGGRLTNIWVNDSAVPMGADLQFVTMPIPMGDETTEDYMPGMILLAARTAPEEPWIGARNTTGNVNVEENEVEIAYDFPLLTEFEITGKFSEKEDMPGVIAWDITIKNKSKQSIEIGELAFPFALNNSLDGFPVGDEGMNQMITERLIVQKFVGGAASYIVARRLCGDPPGLLIFPGKDTSWEFIHSTPLSLRVSPGWSGVPIAYIHSRATVDREGWEDWLYGHSSVVLEPKEEKKYQICFAPITTRHGFEVPLATADYSVPTFRFGNGAVMPVNVPTFLEVAGTRPTQITSDAEDLEIETESDENGAIVVLKKPTPGEARIFVEDMDGRESYCHMLYTPPIADLIKTRAAWIFQHQIASTGKLQHGIVPADNVTNELIEDAFHVPSGILCSLADATFLAEKNQIYADADQIQAIDDYVEKFLLKKFHKQAQGTFNAILPGWEGGVAMDASRAPIYVAAIIFYRSCARLAKMPGLTRTSEQYIELAENVMKGMKSYADRDASINQALQGASQLMDLENWREWRKNFLDDARLPFWSGKQFSNATLDEVYALGETDQSMSVIGSVEQLLLTQKSSSPNWWSYGAEVRSTSDYDGFETFADFGESSPSNVTILGSQALTGWLKRDYTKVDEVSLRLAFAGFLAPWALVREDGAASIGFCPDMGSGQRGMSSYTGDIGFALAEYIRSATMYVLPNPGMGILTHGALVDNYEKEGMQLFRLEPWDGVARKLVVRHMNLEMEVTNGQFEVIEFDNNLKYLNVTVSNPNDHREQSAEVMVNGLWGSEFTVEGATHEMTPEGLKLSTKIAGGHLKEIEVRVL
jgi:hypothetical protein